MNVVIDRSRWACGKHAVESEDSALLTKSGRQCCLGFLATAIGVPLCEQGSEGEGVWIYNELPSCLSECYPWPDDLFGWSVHAEVLSADQPEYRTVSMLEWEDIFARFNDYRDIDDATRESWIATGFKLVLGCEVEFVGEYSI